MRLGSVSVPCRPALALVALAVVSGCDGGGGSAGTEPATITAQPQAQVATVGGTATFQLGATGTNLTYQWLRDGQPIAGATGPSYTTPSLGLTDSDAVYSVTVAASAGAAATSTGARLRVQGIEFVAGEPSLGPGMRDRSGGVAFVGPSGFWGQYFIDSDNATLHTFDIGGFPTTIAGSAGLHGVVDGNGTAARFDHPTAVTSFQGQVFVIDSGGHTLRLVTPNPQLVTFDVGTFAGMAGQPGSADGLGPAARFNAPQGVIGTTSLWIADTGNNTIRAVDANGMVTTVAGSATGPAGFADGTGAGARFAGPTGLGPSGGADILIADTLNNAIRRMTPTGVVTTVAGFSGQPGHADGDVSTATFFHPEGVFDDGTAMYVADTGNHVLRRVDRNGQVTTVAGEAGHGDFLDGTPSRLLSPRGLAQGDRGGLPTIRIADRGNGAVRDLWNGQVAIFMGTPSSSLSIDGADGETSKFHGPRGIAVDANGNAFVADSRAGTIRRVAPSGATTTIAGLADALGSVDGTGTGARFTQPWGVAVDAAGTVYVSDLVGTVRKISSGGVVTTLAGSPSSGSQDGTGAAAGFNAPQALAVDAAGNVYVADTGNHTVRKISPAGVVTTFAGSAGLRGATDGAGNAARFDSPVGIGVDGAGNVLVADGGNRTIRTITPAGVVTTLVGTPGTYGRADGTGAAAQFSLLGGLTVDAAGNVYVTDFATIRRITSAGVVTTAAGVSDPVLVNRPGAPVEAFAGNPIALPGLIRMPHAVAVAPRGLLLVTGGDGVLRVGP